MPLALGPLAIPFVRVFTLSELPFLLSKQIHERDAWNAQTLADIRDARIRWFGSLIRYDSEALFCGQSDDKWIGVSSRRVGPSQARKPGVAKDREQYVSRAIHGGKR